SNQDIENPVNNSGIRHHTILYRNKINKEGEAKSLAANRLPRPTGCQAAFQLPDTLNSPATPDSPAQVIEPPSRARRTAQ
ncbi:MAG: hypothetical protein K8F91_26595, partial [Candidatus Obscuribacterales bacterium]|nr:hypothetical protein [Candidatus Obscuribacterales bacterium]